MSSEQDRASDTGRASEQDRASDTGRASEQDIVVVRVVVYGDEKSKEDINFPETIDVQAASYYDVVAEFVSRGYRTGRIMGDSGAEVNYNDAVSLRQVDYFMYPGKESSKGLTLFEVNADRDKEMEVAVPCSLNMRTTDIWLYLRILHNVANDIFIYHVNEDETLTLMIPEKSIRHYIGEERYSKNSKLEDQAYDVKIIFSTIPLSVVAPEED